MCVLIDALPFDGGVPDETVANVTGAV
jgi:hypothetical protein